MLYKNLKNRTLQNNNQLNIKLILKKLLNTFLISFGSILAIIIALSLWIGISLYAGPDAMEINDYHPFKSEKAKVKFTEIYDTYAQDWPVAYQDTLIETSYGYTSVKVCGKHNAQPLVILNGGGSNSLLWIPNIEGLAEHCKIYAIEHVYDFGKSIYEKEINNATDFTNYFDELFTKLQLEDSINLMGLSYGGWISSQCALEFPERLNKVILVAPAMTVLPFNKETLKRMIVGVVPSKYMFKKTIYWTFEDAITQEKEHQEFVDKYIDLGYIAFRSFKFKQLPHPTILSDEDWQNIKVPLMFVVGENEKIYSAENAVERLNSVNQSVRTEIIPNAGHDLTIVQSERFNNLVLDFLKN